jgi:predicted enzyme related to lactoylglutathione lyase
MVQAGTHGALNWVDLSTPDIAGAMSFYADLLGWKVSHEATPMGEYHIGNVGDFQVAGMMAQSPEMAGSPAMWTTFFYVTDIDETAAAVERLGGKVLTPPFEIPGGAQIGVIADPTGAMFALIGGGPAPEGEYVSCQPGTVTWVELLTREPETAGDFYRSLFGWESRSEPTEGGDYTVFTLQGEEVAGMMLMPPQVPAEAPSHWSVYFAVPDCAATANAAVDLGGQVLVPATDVGEMTFAVLADPQGATFDVMQYREQPAASSQ